MSSRDKAGFTLVELAIVLVIIGLIIGGVLAGQTLIRNAEIRSIMNEKTEIESAINTFRAKYGALPGDMRDATRYWGAQDADWTTCVSSTTASDTGATCNGNGDGTIGGANLFYERFRAWQQLGNDGLVRGSFTGVPGPNWDGVLGSVSTQDAVIGENVLASSTFDGAGWNLLFIGSINDTVKAASSPWLDSWFNGNYRHVIGLGLAVPVIPGLGTLPVGALLTPSEAKTLDEKVDDGWPGKGVMRSFVPISSTHALALLYQNDCATSDDPEVAEYNIHATDANIECVPMLITKF